MSLNEKIIKWAESYIIFPVKDAIFWIALIFPVKVSYSSFR
jgi:hypothetical protein